MTVFQATKAGFVVVTTKKLSFELSKSISCTLVRSLDNLFDLPADPLLLVLVWKKEDLNTWVLSLKYISGGSPILFAWFGILEILRTAYWSYDKRSFLLDCEVRDRVLLCLGYIFFST